MAIEYFRVSHFADSTVIHDCVWLFILLAVSLAVKKSLQCVARTTQWLATQNTSVQLVLHPVAFSDNELAEACDSSVDFMLSAKPSIPNLVQRLPYAATPSVPGRCSLPSAIAPDAVVLGCCASPQRTYVGCAIGWVGTAVPPSTARANRADPLPARYQAMLPLLVAPSAVGKPALAPPLETLIRSSLHEHGAGQLERMREHERAVDLLRRGDRVRTQRALRRGTIPRPQLALGGIHQVVHMRAAPL